MILEDLTVAALARARLAEIDVAGGLHGFDVISQGGPLFGEWSSVARARTSRIVLTLGPLRWTQPTITANLLETLMSMPSEVLEAVRYPGMVGVEAEAEGKKMLA